MIYRLLKKENTIPKVRLDYLHRIQTTYDKLLPDVNYKLTTDLSMSDKKAAQNRQADLNAKLQEINEYDEKIAYIANQKIRVVQKEGNRSVSREVNFYNLDAIISVGYRVNSRRATKFRIWATNNGYICRMFNRL